MTDHAKGLILVVFIIFLLSLVGSWFSIMSLNVLFGLNIPISFETIMAGTWLTMTLKGIFSTNSLNTKK